MNRTLVLSSALQPCPSHYTKFETIQACPLLYSTNHRMLVNGKVSCLVYRVTKYVEKTIPEHELEEIHYHPPHHQTRLDIKVSCVDRK